MNTKNNRSIINFPRVLALAGTLAMAGCREEAPLPPAPPAPPPVGRYQISTVMEGERGTTVVLLDTTTGESWLYHAPQGPLYNGFWGDVPRVTSPGETWRQAFQTLMQDSLTNQPATIPFRSTK
jgi:hypothetical protein